MCSSFAQTSDQPLDLDQLYVAYAAAHLSIAWAAFVLDHVVDRRDELLARYDCGVDAHRGLDDHDDRRRLVIAWLRNLPSPPTSRQDAERRPGARASQTFDSHEGGSPCAARS